MNKPYLMLLALALPAVACKKLGDSSAPPYDEYRAETEQSAYEGELAVERDFADDETMIAHAELASPPPEPQMAPEPRTPAVSDGSGPTKAVADDNRADVARQIIYTATMAVSVFNVDEALDKAEALPERFGGWVATMSSETLVVKVPSKHLRTAMDEFASMGIVEYRTLESQDVSDQYYDLQTRIAVLEKTQVQMMALLSKARDVTEALSVRKALDEITLELEVLKGRMRKMKTMVAFSTLTLSLSERGPHDPIPTSNDPFPWVDQLGVEATEWK